MAAVAVAVMVRQRFGNSNVTVAAAMLAAMATLTMLAAMTTMTVTAVARMTTTGAITTAVAVVAMATTMAAVATAMAKSTENNQIKAATATERAMLTETASAPVTTVVVT